MKTKSKFLEHRESLPLEEREKFTKEVWKHKPDNWVNNPNWVEGAYYEYLKIMYLENKLVGGKSGTL